MSWEEVIRFWFEETTPRQWFTKDTEFDKEVRSRFLDTYYSANKGETEGWRATPEGRLAEILVLDQFPRNMFRGTPESFSGDTLALSLAEEAVRIGDDMRLDGRKRYFIYMPYMHSESPEIHRKALWLFLRLPFKEWRSWISFEHRHKRIIDRFGRYPHRNEILGRSSTPEELEFMKHNPGF